MKKFLLMVLVSIMFFAGFVNMVYAKGKEATRDQERLIEIQKHQQQIQVLVQRRDKLVLQFNIEILKLQAVLDYLQKQQKEEKK